jgi:(S)-ureidoglycine aminohydrolase
MKKITGILCLFIPVTLMAQTDSLLSGIYSWKEPVQKVRDNILSATLFEGIVPGNEEHLLIIKSGMLTIDLKDSSWLIGSGSVVLLIPGEKYTVQNKGSESCNFYEMKYRSKLPMDIARGKISGGSLVKDWSKIAFKPHDKGGIRNFFERPTAMCKRLEMHVTTLNQGIKSHDPHQHRAEEIVLVKDNKTKMQIADKFYKGNTGSIYYLGSNVLHAIQNDAVGTCTYFAFQFE